MTKVKALELAKPLDNETLATFIRLAIPVLKEYRTKACEMKMRIEAAQIVLTSRRKAKK